MRGPCLGRFQLQWQHEQRGGSGGKADVVGVGEEQRGGDLGV